MKKQSLVTRDSMQALVDNPATRSAAIGRALVVLFNRQTVYEKTNNTTQVHNAIGFTGADGRSGVLSAKSYLKNGGLMDWQIERWARKGKSGYSRITKYWAQLNEEALAKREQQAA